MEKKMKIYRLKYDLKEIKILFPKWQWLFLFVCIIWTSTACQKELKLKYDIGEPKQVIIANIYPNNPLQISISKSKAPNDYSSIEFLNDCTVDLYEDGIFKETLFFILRDTLSGLGFYTSSLNVETGKTYKIISTHPTLGVAEAEEKLPENPIVTNHQLIQHADITDQSKLGKYSISFQDNAAENNYYFLATFYRILKPVIKTNGDTVYKNDYILVPSYFAENRNLSNFHRTYFTDETFNGLSKTIEVEFPSLYNSIYKEIELIVEFSNCGNNFYNWNIQQVPLGNDYLNEGQIERNDLKGNIKNGYGHFTASNSYYFGYRIK
ncbi:MAG: DUF4249 family protein [Chitinophagales bacterium]|nr:DUF4249 family protein [Chitinophagales bacterium]